MNLRGNVLTEQQAKEISTWHYEGEYVLYDLPSWGEMHQQDYAYAILQNDNVLWPM